jgi:hypothetical protein
MRISEEMRLSLVDAYRVILAARVTEFERIKTDREIMADVDKILKKISTVLEKNATPQKL